MEPRMTPNLPPGMSRDLMWAPPWAAGAPEPSPARIRARLLLLAEEREAAEHAGLTADRAYMDDLEADVRENRHALTESLVTELAVRRAARFGRFDG
jgi:hypothetical protein